MAWGRLRPGWAAIVGGALGSEDAEGGLAVQGLHGVVHDSDGEGPVGLGLRQQAGLRGGFGKTAGDGAVAGQGAAVREHQGRYARPRIDGEVLRLELIAGQQVQRIGLIQ